jgi:hypothetical protein
MRCSNLVSDDQAISGTDDDEASATKARAANTVANIVLLYKGHMIHLVASENHGRLHSQRQTTTAASSTQHTDMHMTHTKKEGQHVHGPIKTRANV